MSRALELWVSDSTRAGVRPAAHYRGYCVYIPDQSEGARWRTLLFPSFTGPPVPITARVHSTPQTRRWADILGVGGSWSGGGQEGVRRESGGSQEGV
eukprot:1076438-Prorocentrum_minimum.AAC.1